jgi:AmiR/NasT family two-component response regulator
VKQKFLIVEDQFVEANDIQLMLRKAGYEVCGIARTVEIAREVIRKEKPDFVLLDISLKGKLTGIDLGRELKEDNIAFIYLSANSDEQTLNAAKTTEPYGFIVKPFREKDLLTTLEIARYRHEHSAEANSRKENILQEKLFAITNDASDWREKLFTVCTTLKPHISFDYVTAGFNAITDISTKAISFLRIGYEQYQTMGTPELLTIAGLKINDLTTLVRNTPYDAMPTIVAEKTFELASSKPSLTKLFSDLFQIKSFIYYPLHLSNGNTFIFCFYCKRPDTYNTAHIGLMNRLQEKMTPVVESILNQATDRIAVPKKSESPFPSIDAGNG